LSKRVHLLSIWLVSFGTILSAFWILSANSFMQNPVGFEQVDGRAQMTSMSEILLNPHLWSQFPHVFLTAIATGSFLVAGISAYKMIKKENLDMFVRSFKISISLGAVVVFLTLFTGHLQAQYIVKAQPMKLAAAEAQWDTSADPAPFTLVAKIDSDKKENTLSLDLPYMLSFFAYDEFSGSLEGLNQLQEKYEKEYGTGNYIPPVKTLFLSFRAMVGSGSVMILLGLYGIYNLRKDKILQKTWYLKAMVAAIVLPFIANSTGWIMTEMGRQPFVVFGIMKTEDAVSPSVSAGEMLFSLIAFNLMYATLGALSIYLFVRYIKKTDFDEITPLDDSKDPFDQQETKGGANIGS